MEKIKYHGLLQKKNSCLNILQCVTIVIKTRHREEYTVQLIKSIFKFYRGINIVVVDEIINSFDEKQFSSENITFSYKRVANLSTNIIYVQTKPGVSFGRNIGLQMAATKYALFIDDDFIFTDKTNIAKLLLILETTDVSIAGGYLQPDNFFNGIFRVIPVSTFL